MTNPITHRLDSADEFEKKHQDAVRAREEVHNEQIAALNASLAKERARFAQQKTEDEAEYQLARRMRYPLQRQKSFDVLKAAVDQYIAADRTTAATAHLAATWREVNEDCIRVLGLGPAQRALNLLALAFVHSTIERGADVSRFNDPSVYGGGPGGLGAVAWETQTALAGSTTDALIALAKLEQTIAHRAAHGNRFSTGLNFNVLITAPLEEIEEELRNLAKEQDRRRAEQFQVQRGKLTRARAGDPGALEELTPEEASGIRLLGESVFGPLLNPVLGGIKRVVMG